MVNSRDAHRMMKGQLGPAMPSTPAVSFLIPARNRPEELKAALASCLAQSCDAWEALVVDDHSESADLQGLVEAFGDCLLYTSDAADE